ncbi:M14 family metallopeptidase [Flavobacterium psychrophilum]|uniref:M14 family metallopeptidase n=1 Tax=Flavobacterium psychrophilum TaxID=96345 RepID=UPI0006187878|nr:M14 metallopeptidase family protein [Flavobacterium psychrophilum]AKC19013.1 peptidase M14 [Flavobacterium psychrophilum]AKC23753.1 peptidase M14 [Flavobacterium psychrophilum]AKC26067.1 peptidase M14 [Flavobacterium psychrophilum]AKC28381.1 peptidase M14 [Flavobacterium psychrophilum]MCB6002637.1 M14 family metallopeptidase [Flavobacterium psychrophilum]
MNLIKIFSEIKQQKLFGRYITNKHIEPILETFSNDFEVSTIGYSVNKKPIYAVEIGTGSRKIFMWSQMHGNESTTTKALFDLFSFLKQDSEQANKIKKEFTLLCIPILNPDGAEVYTRENANKIDLNRDSVNLSQPESQLLREMFKCFKPDYCFNLHDQRTIFAVNNTRNPATVSFLAPAYNEARAYNDTRGKAINVIVAMNDELQKHIPNQVGRFDDSFNINCIGDMFQSLNVPTILFEAGHYQGDYEREETRKYIFVALLSGLQFIYNNNTKDDKTINYLNIAQNKVSFVDFIYRNFSVNYKSLNIITTFAAQFKEILINDKIVFEAYFTEIEDEMTFFGHQEYDGKKGDYSDDSNNFPEIGKKANFRLNKSIKFVNGLIKTQ